MASHGTAEDRRQKAQAHFAKAEERQREAAKVYSEVQLKREAEAAKTARLRALRLAKEAADAQAKQSPAAVPSSLKPVASKATGAKPKKQAARKLRPAGDPQDD